MEILTYVQVSLTVVFYSKFIMRYYLDFILKIYLGLLGFPFILDVVTYSSRRYIIKLYVCNVNGYDFNLFNQHWGGTVA